MVAAAVDINIQAQEMEKLREELNGILAKTSGQPLEKIQQDTDRDFYLNAEEAIEYGLADEIVDTVWFIIIFSTLPRLLFQDFQQ